MPVAKDYSKAYEYFYEKIKEYTANGDTVEAKALEPKLTELFNANKRDAVVDSYKEGRRQDLTDKKNKRTSQTLSEKEELDNLGGPVVSE